MCRIYLHIFMCDALVGSGENIHIYLMRADQRINKSQNKLELYTHTFAKVIDTDNNSNVLPFVECMIYLRKFNKSLYYDI